MISSRVRAAGSPPAPSGTARARTTTPATRRCTTRWATEDKAGLIFLEPIAYNDLGPWLEHCNLDS